MHINGGHKTAVQLQQFLYSDTCDVFKAVARLRIDSGEKAVDEAQMKTQLDSLNDQLDELGAVGQAFGIEALSCMVSLAQEQVQAYRTVIGLQQTQSPHQGAVETTPDEQDDENRAEPWVAGCADARNWLHKIAQESLSNQIASALLVDDQDEISDELDAVLTCGDDQIVKAHMWVLTSRWSFFNDMVNSGMRESTTKQFNFPDLSFDVLRAMVSFLYSQQIDQASQDNLEILISLLLAGDQYLLEVLKAHCCVALRRYLANQLRLWKVGGCGDKEQLIEVVRMVEDAAGKVNAPRLQRFAMKCLKRLTTARSPPDEVTSSDNPFHLDGPPRYEFDFNDWPHWQRPARLSITPERFHRAAFDTLCDYTNRLRFSSSALQFLQEASEDFLQSLFARAAAIAKRQRHTEQENRDEDPDEEEVDEDEDEAESCSVRHLKQAVLEAEEEQRQLALIVTSGSEQCDVSPPVDG